MGPVERPVRRSPSEGSATGCKGGADARASGGTEKAAARRLERGLENLGNRRRFARWLITVVDSAPARRRARGARSAADERVMSEAGFMLCD
jgi:hypothetical protein